MKILSSNSQIRRHTISRLRTNSECSQKSLRMGKRNPKDPQRPFYRDDIFYGGSLMRLPHYRSQVGSEMSEQFCKKILKHRNVWSESIQNIFSIKNKKIILRDIVLSAISSNRRSVITCQWRGCQRLRMWRRRKAGVATYVRKVCAEFWPQCST